MCSCASRYFCVDIFSIFRVIALDLVNISNFQLVSQVTKKYLTQSHETLQECCSACVVVHLGIFVWIYLVFLELLPFTK
jgi:hypothetical protein